MNNGLRSLRGGVAALAVASGAAAVTYVIQNLAQSGGHIVAAKNVYGGTYNLLAHTLADYGVTTTFVDPLETANFENAIQENTKALYIETLGNPNSEVADIEEVAKIAHSHKIPLVVDSTFGNAVFSKTQLHMVQILWCIPQQSLLVDMVLQ